MNQVQINKNNFEQTSDLSFLDKEQSKVLPLGYKNDVMSQLFGNQLKSISKEDLMNEKESYLITGITGFVGSHLAKFLREKNFNVIGIVRDIIPSEWLSYALDGCILVNGDIRNKNLIKRLVDHYKINNIYHIAAHASVKESINIPIETFETNVMGTLNILEAIRYNPKFNESTGNNQVIILNTDKVYGEKQDAIETDPYQHSEIYATSKCCQGFVAKTYMDVYNLNIKMLHSCNIFGLDIYNDRLIPNTIKECIKERSPVIYTNDDSIREYIYIDDVINALYLLLSDTNEKGSYNVSTGYIYNQKDIVNKIVEYYNDVNFSDVKSIEKEGKIPLQIQKQSLKSVKWNFNPQWKFEDALAETIDQFLIYKGDWE